MVRFDAVVIGGGVLGCFAARNLRRWRISTALLEAKEDVCTGITRSNTAIVYPGYDSKPGSLKSRMTIQGNAEFGSLCETLEVPFARRGSLMVSYGPRADAVLKKKLEAGLLGGVPGLRLISGREAREMEPMLAPGVSSALFAPSTGTVNPWLFGIAAFENAVRNGCAPMLNTKVLGIRSCPEGYILETDREEIACRVVLNCAGLSADKVQELLFPPSVRLFCDGADFLILDKHARSPERILFQESEEKGKGVTAVPTVDGNLLLGPSRQPLQGKPWATTHEGMDYLRKQAKAFLPELQTELVIRSFASVRPNPHRVVPREGEYVPDGTSIGSFVIEHPAPGFYSLIGIKTPGLTCADRLGMYLAEEAADFLSAPVNQAFDPRREAIRRKDSEIVCLCGKISKAEIQEAIRRGAVTVDGVKRRVGTGMGPCQGSRCARTIEALLKEAKHGTL